MTNKPGTLQSIRHQLATSHDGDIRRQLHLSLIIIIVLLSATLGTMISMAAPIH